MAETIIDQITEEKGNVILSLRQGAPWDDRTVLVEFQRRLNGYIDVVTQGVLYEQFPDLKHRPVRIRLICYHEPAASMREKFDRLNQTLAELGIGFEIRMIKVEAGRMGDVKEGILSLFNRLRGKNR